ncbi:MAG: Gfo/Idh/MocA family oxidoreductase [Chitinophagaceae bacterium]|nr:Gfo/Idh/MocA family oxidoreductase [Chitinophagaceae bacterium]
MEKEKSEKKLGIALVGLGKYSAGQLAPALQETQHCYLAGIVTGSALKASEWKARHHLPDTNIYDYTTFDSIAGNKDIDIVYVVLPNSMHAEYVIRAAKAGKHVICEKPMALTVEDCDRMITACKEAGKMLSIGYRLHFEPHTRELIEYGRSKRFGEWNLIRAENGMGSTEGWRLNKEMAGGGPLMDVGIYCVQGTRYITGLEPISVTAQEGPKKSPERFKNIEESLSWQFEFPNGIIAQCKSSYADEYNLLRAEGSSGWVELSPAYAYNGIKGKTSEINLSLPEVNQQAKQMDDFAIAIKSNRPTPVPGEMGRQDVKLLQAIYQAMKTGEKIMIG